MSFKKSTEASFPPSFWGLLPLFTIFVLFGLTWIFAGSPDKLPVSVAFLVTSIVAIFTSRNTSITHRINVYCRGAANDTIMFMVLIFVLAGAFAGTAKAMGAVDATVSLTLSILPEQLVIASIFIASCFISMAMGTSCGTIAALTPIAVGIASQTGIGLPFMVGVVIGGSMFGDSLSFISDTTIVATRTQGCEMKDKFKVNIRILYPITIILTCIYIYAGWNLDSSVPVSLSEIQWIKVVPYLVVFIGALAGLNVILVLILGIVLSGLIGLFTGSFGIWEWTSSMQTGVVTDMGELIIVSFMAGGLFEVIRFNGGIDWLINKLSKNIKNKRQAEFRIASLVGFTDMCTANNTVALIITGPIARRIGEQFNIDKRRMASLIDTSSCTIQGILPYGAQLLIAAGLSGIAPMQIIPYLYYPFLMGITVFITILLQLPRKYT